MNGMPDLRQDYIYLLLLLLRLALGAGTYELLMTTSTDSLLTGLFVACDWIAWCSNFSSRLQLRLLRLRFFASCYTGTCLLFFFGYHFNILSHFILVLSIGLFLIYKAASCIPR